MEIFKKHILSLLRKSTTLREEELSSILEVPPNPNFGDYSFPCFLIAKELKQNPLEVANNISKYFVKDDHIERVECKGAYVNFFINKSKLNEIVLKEVLKRKYNYGSSFIGKGKKALIEHTSINPNAEPHVGRARNALIGDSLVKLLKFLGYKVEVHYYVNDIGKQIAMLVLAANNKKVKFKELLNLYIKINKDLETNPEIEKNVFELLNKLEKGNKKIRKQFNDIVEICINGQSEILSDLGINYDHFDYESTYLFNKDCETILKDLKNKNLFTDEQNRQVVDLREFSIPGGDYFVLTRNDGTSLYGLRDLAYTIYKIKKAKDRNIVVLGEDQKLYFTQLRVILNILNYKAPEIVHYSFVLLQEGKMSTRKGNVVLLSEFMEESRKKAQEELNKRNNKDKRLAKIIGYGALKYSILKNSPEKNVIFDWEQALTFEGESCPYIQYSYARACSILKKCKLNNKIDFSLLVKKEEAALIKLLSEFPGIILKSSKDLKPNYIANYSYELAQKFNEFYHNCNVIQESKDLKNSRTALVLAFTYVLKTSLSLLGIETPEKM